MGRLHAMRFTVPVCGSGTHTMQLASSACGLLAVVPGVVHTVPGVMGRVHRSVDGSLYPRRMILSLKLTSHLSLSNTTLHPALHNTLMPKSEAMAKFGTMCPVSVVGRPGMLISQMCIDFTCLPSDRLIISCFVAGL